MNTNTLAQNQSIVDEYIKKHTKTSAPENNPMKKEDKVNYSDTSLYQPVNVKLPSEEERAKQIIESRNEQAKIQEENNKLLKSIDAKLSNIEKGVNILLSHMQNIEINMNQPF